MAKRAVLPQRWEDLSPDLQRNWADLRDIIEEDDLVDVIAEWAAYLDELDAEYAKTVPEIVAKMNADDEERGRARFEGRTR